MMNRLKVECYYTGQDEQATEASVGYPTAQGHPLPAEEAHDEQVGQPSAPSGDAAEKIFDRDTHQKVLKNPDLKDRDGELAAAARQALKEDKTFFMWGGELVRCAECKFCDVLCLRLIVRSGKFSCSDCRRQVL
jgi:hypothetical protein